MTPAIDIATLIIFIKIPLKATNNMSNIGKAKFKQAFARITRAITAATN
jgi:hypothetical protein